MDEEEILWKKVLLIFGLQKMSVGICLREVLIVIKIVQIKNVKVGVGA